MTRYEATTRVYKSQGASNTLGIFNKGVITVLTTTSRCWIQSERCDDNHLSKGNGVCTGDDKAKETDTMN